MSMGIYVMEPEVLEHIPDNQYFDFPHLVETMLELGLPIGSYRYDGLWFDIGRQEDYEEAVSAWAASDGGDIMEHLAIEQEARTGKRPIEPVTAEPRAHIFEAEQQRRAVALGRRRQRQRQRQGLGESLEWNGPDASSAGVVGDDFRDTLAGVPAPVTIVTTSSPEGPHGTTVSAFSSLSADPPLVLVALDRKSDLLNLLPQTGEVRREPARRRSGRPRADVREEGRREVRQGPVARGPGTAAHRRAPRLARL